jgi:hypothetical protein
MADAGETEPLEWSHERVAEWVLTRDYPLNVAVYPLNMTHVRLLDGQSFDVGFTIGLAQPWTLKSFWHHAVYFISDSS